MSQSLNKITDHPKINLDETEVARIGQSLNYYRGIYPKVSYSNSNGHKKERELSSLNMLKKVSNEYAKVVFNEQCEITVSGQAEEFIEKVFQANDFKKNFSKYLEPMFALGGLACRPYYDSDTEQMRFSWALADSFYPLNSNSNNISECALPFSSTKTEGGKTYYYTLLELHEWQGGNYVITNELYKSEEAGQVGNQINLEELYPGMNPVTIISGLSRPLFSYLKPSGFNNISPRSSLGLGVCDNCKKTLDRINQTYDQFDQEIKMGKRRVAATEAILKPQVDELGRGIDFTFDEDETIYQMVPGQGMDDFTVKDLTSDIRSEAYIATINKHLQTLEMETALSSGTFTFDKSGLHATKTATEVVSENSQTYQTRGMQVVEIEKFIKELVVSVCELAKSLGVYDGEIPSYDDIAVDFQDGAFQDKDSQLDFYLKLYNAGVIPSRKVAEDVMGLTEAEAVKLRKEAMDEVAAKVSGMMFEKGLDDEEE